MSEAIMSAGHPDGKITRRDRQIARLWQWAPWLTFPVVTIGPPAAFWLAYLLASTDATVFLLLAFSSIPFALIAAVIMVLLLVVLRRRWARRLRERLASDGVTADEIEWFMPELTRDERRALKGMEQQPLLADAYRETLALRLNASRLAASARRDLLQVERRLNRARYLNAPDTAVLVEELRRDRARLEGVKQEGASRRAEAEARLQMIEAAASRGASWSETNYMLQRLDEGRTHVPLGLESARAEQQVREDTQRELRTSQNRLP
jgi:hypothetical protein